MARGGFRPGAGRPKGTKKKKEDVALEKVKAERLVDSISPSATSDQSPLDYMLSVMNDDNADEMRRDRMAIAAAPFVHAKKGESGKKDEAAEKAKAAMSRFGARTPPSLVVNNTK